MDGATLLKFYRQMLLIRRFEEEAARAYTERKIGGFLHLYNGQEAVGTGVINATEDRDYVITAYRDHGQYLLRGGNPRAGMAELFGKATGASGGRGGSMHLFNAERNFLGGHGIVGAHVPLAAGAAFASKYRNEGAVCVCFLGEGAVNIGPFHEGLCLATVWGLPVLYVIENNFYAMGTPMSRSLITDTASVRALGYPMARDSVEGVDIKVCYETAQKAIARVREESKPMLLEFKTYRHRGHSMADPAKYRTKEEVEEWKKRDPLVIAEKHLQKDYLEEAKQIDELKKSVDEEIADAVKFAHESPEPDPTTVGHHTYVD